VEVGKALVHFGTASFPLPPQAHVNDKAPLTHVENLERIHSYALPGLPQLVPLTAHALPAAKWWRVCEDGRDVELSVLGVQVLHEVEFTAVPALKALLEALDDLG